MVLYCRYVYTFRRKDFFGTLDLGEVMVGHADVLHFSALYQCRHVGRPAFHIRRVMNPVDVDVVRIEAREASGKHIGYGIFRIARDLRCELRGDFHLLAAACFGKCRKHVFRCTHAIDDGGIPKIQPVLHGFVKYGLQFFHAYVVAEYLVAAYGSCAP